MDRNRRNHPDRFCYVCDRVVLPDRQAKITEFVKKAYHAYFGIKLWDQDKLFAPHICCKACGIGEIRKGRVCHSLFQWCRGKEKITLRTAISVWQIWKESIARTKIMFNILIFLLQLDWSLMVQTSCSWVRCSYDIQLRLSSWRIQARRRPASAFHTSRTQRSDTRPRPFKGVCSATGFTSQREKPVGAGNNIILASRLREWIKTFVHFPGGAFIGLLQQLCWIG